MSAERQHVRAEPAGVRVSAVLMAAGGFALLVAVAMAVVWVMFGLAGQPRRDQGAAPAPPLTAFPAPRLQAEPPLDLERLRRREAARLQGYAWVDRNRGLVRIPIERAMRLIAGRGADGYAPVAAGEAPGPRAAPAPAAGEGQP